MKKQYALSNNLILVPVPAGEDTAHFSLLKGVWTNFYTGREYCEGEWTEHNIQTDSVILVRENSVIIQNTDDGCELRVYALCDGIRVDADVYDNAEENPALSVSFKRSGHSIHIASDGTKPYTVRMINMYAKSAANGFITIDGSDSVITPDAWACTMEIVF